MPDLRGNPGANYNKLMKFSSLILAFFISNLSFAQDLESILNPSLKLLQGPIPVSDQFSCFDYENKPPAVFKARRIDCSKPFKLPVGKFLEMYRNHYRSGNYLLSRTGEKSYQAILNLNFVPDLEPHSGKAGDQALAQMMLARTRNCLQEMKPYLRGPNGEELEVVISGEGNLPFGMQKPQQNNVKVSYQGKNFRGNADNFGSSFECTTIGHEILHHLGLCDEYHEGVIETPGMPDSDWSCRPVTARNSYMRNMNFAYQTTLPLTSRCECDEGCQKIMKTDGKAKTIFLSMNGNEIMGTETSIVAGNNSKNPDRQVCKTSNTQSVKEDEVPNKAFTLDSHSGNVYKFSSYRVFAGDTIFYDKTTYECECKPHQPYCQKLILEMKKYAEKVPLRATCPDGIKARSTAPSIGYDSKGTRMECQNGKCDLIISTTGSGKSLLSPTQFQKILGGSCEGASPAYESCEKYAYMAKSDPECSKMPVECHDDNYYLGADH